MGTSKRTALYLVKSGERATSILEKTFREHEAALRSFLRARLSVEADHEDIIQKLFLRLMQKDRLSERLSEGTGNTRSYLQTILNGMLIDMLRKQNSEMKEAHTSFDEEAVAVNNGDPQSIASNREQLETMHKILKRMESKYRQVLVLNRFQHKSCRQIAQHMGVSEATVERRLAVALALIREGMT